MTLTCAADIGQAFANEPGLIIAALAISGGLLVGTISVVGGLIAGIVTTRSKEQSRREIAAYVAEGSMSPDEGERLLNAGPRGGSKKNCLW